jgi:hypothetical protein
MDVEHHFSPEDLPPLSTAPAAAPAAAILAAPSTAAAPAAAAAAQGFFGLPFYLAYHGQFPDALKIKKTVGVGPVQLSIAGIWERSTKEFYHKVSVKVGGGCSLQALWWVAAPLARRPSGAAQQRGVRCCRTGFSRASSA